MEVGVADESRPLPPDPRVVEFFEGVSLPALAVAAGIALLRFIGRFLEEGDPWRQLSAQALLYVGAFVAIAVSIWVRHRGGWCSARSRRRTSLYDSASSYGVCAPCFATARVYLHPCKGGHAGGAPGPACGDRADRNARAAQGAKQPRFAINSCSPSAVIRRRVGAAAGVLRRCSAGSNGAFVAIAALVWVRHRG